MAPIDIVIDIIERKQKALWEKTEGMVTGEAEDLRAEGGFKALEDLKNELEGFKKLFN